MHLTTGAEWAHGQLSGAKAGNMGRLKNLVLVPKSVEIKLDEKLEHRVHDAYRHCTNDVARPEPCRESAGFFDLFRVHASGRRWTKRQKGGGLGVGEGNITLCGLKWSRDTSQLPERTTIHKKQWKSTVIRTTPFLVVSSCPPRHPCKRNARSAHVSSACRRCHPPSTKVDFPTAPVPFPSAVAATLAAPP